MRRAVAAVVLAGAVLVAATPADAALSSKARKAVFVSVVRAEGIPAKPAVKLGKMFCREVDASSAEDAIAAFLAAAIVEFGDDEDGISDVGFILGAATGAFCPEHEDDVEAAWKALGAG